MVGYLRRWSAMVWIVEDGGYKISHHFGFELYPCLFGNPVSGNGHVHSYPRTHMDYTFRESNARNSAKLSRWTYEWLSLNGKRNAGAKILAGGKIKSSKETIIYWFPWECFLLNNQFREDARHDDATLVAVRMADGTFFSELLFIILRVEEKVDYLEPTIVYF